MAKILVTFVLDVDTDNPAETAQEVSNQLESYEGWQIFGEDSELEDSVITGVNASVIG